MRRAVVAGDRHVPRAHDHRAQAFDALRLDALRDRVGHGAVKR